MEEELKNNVKEMLENGKKRKDIAKKLNITLYMFDKIKKELIANNELDLKQMEKVTNSQKKITKNIEEINFSSPENKARFEVIDLLSKRYLNYSPGQKFNTFLCKKIEAMSYAYSYSIILATAKKCLNNMDYANSNKEFNNEVQKISYLCAIIKNNLNNTLKEREKREQRNKGLEKREINYEEANKVIVTTKTKRRDFSIYLDDDEY